MKTKNYLSMLAVMMVAMLSLGFVSCGDDDDDAAVGTWYRYDYDHTVREMWIFKNGGKGVCYEYYKGERDDETKETFTYKMKSDHSGVVVFDNLDIGDWDFKIKNNVMYFYDQYHGDDSLWELKRK